MAVIALRVFLAENGRKQLNINYGVVPDGTSLLIRFDIGLGLGVNIIS